MLGYKNKLDEVDEAIRVNAEFLSKIVENPEIFVDEDDTEHENGTPGTARGHSHDEGM